MRVSGAFGTAIIAGVLLAANLLALGGEPSGRRMDGDPEPLRPRSPSPSRWRDPRSSRTFGRRHPSLVALRSSTGSPSWFGTFDPQHHRPRCVYGAGVDLSDPLTEAPAVIARRILDVHVECFALAPSSFRFARESVRGPIHVVHFVQVFDGLPVRGSRADVTLRRVDDGSGSHWVWNRLDLEAIDAAPRPLVGFRSPEEAIARAQAIVVGAVDVRAPRLELLPVPSSNASDGNWTGRPVYTIEVRTEHPVALRRLHLDARTLECCANVDTTCDLDVVGHAEGWGSPELWPDLPTQPPVLQPLAGLQIVVPGFGETITDALGNFVVPGGGTDPVDLWVGLQGPFVQVQNASGPEATVAATLLPGTPSTLTFGASSNATEIAQINGFVHTNIAHDFLATLAPNSALDIPLPCVVNESTGGCVAYYSDGEIHFSVAGGACVNTAYSTIVYHEYAHAILDLEHGFDPGSYHEGMADAYSALLTDDPNVGLAYESGLVLRNVDTRDRGYP
ncbi:MAG: hypothetical protein KDC38_08145, partial [Planctomycetes bacterium]|nr:hypothetical protein [Planctomycetota bacterium]